MESTSRHAFYGWKKKKECQRLKGCEDTAISTRRKHRIQSASTVAGVAHWVQEWKERKGKWAFAVEAFRCVELVCVTQRMGTVLRAVIVNCKACMSYLLLWCFDIHPLVRLQSFKNLSRFSRIQFRIIWVGTPDILALEMTDISYARSAESL
jgi:hypothetical protein